MKREVLAKKIKKYLKERNIFYIKFNDKFTLGIPDFCIFLKGYPGIWIETKRPNEGFQPNQEYTIEKINESLDVAFAIRSYDVFLTLMKSINNAMKGDSSIVRTADFESVDPGCREYKEEK